MIALMRPWVLNIVYVIFFLIISDIILPEGDIKQYVKVIMGLFILLVIVKPLIEFKKVDSFFESVYIETSSFIETEQLNEDLEVISSISRNKTIDIYKNKIENSIYNIIEQEIEVNRDEISIELDIEEDYSSIYYGQINSIIIYISNNPSGSRIDTIKKISIKKSKNVINKDEVEYNFNEKMLISELKNKLNKTLGVKVENIDIKITIDKN